MGGLLSNPVTSRHMKRSGNTHMRVGMCEVQGYRPDMEDYSNVELSLPDHDVSLFGVYDGHGGEACSGYISKHIPIRLNALKDPLSEQDLTDLLVKVDKDFMEIPAEQTNSAGSACIFALVSSEGDQWSESKSDHRYRVKVVNVGDSRSLLLRKDRRVVELSEDHKPDHPVEKARIQLAGGFTNMNRVDGQLALSRAVGDTRFKQNDELRYDQQKVIAIPEFKDVMAYPGDTLLIFCDGVVERLSNEDVAAFVFNELETTNDVAEVASKLIDKSILSGSRDNHTVIVVQFTDGSDYNASDQFIPGPYRAYARNEDFSKAYITFAAKCGYEGERLMEMVRVIDANHTQQLTDSDLVDMKEDDDDDDEDIQLSANVLGGGNLMFSQQLQMLVKKLVQTQGVQVLSGGGMSRFGPFDGMPAAEMSEEDVEVFEEEQSFV